MSAQLSGATAFITGGAQGIGLGIARALAEQGTRLALVDVDAAALERATAELGDKTAVQGHVLDVRDREAYAEVADKVEAELGPVTLLFNNAGVAGGSHVSQMTYEKWDWMLGVNVTGVVNGIQTFVPRMVMRGAGGYVVNTSSGAGLVGEGGGFLYTTSKFAVVGLSEALSVELEPFGIGVSVLCPGPVATDIVRNTWNIGPDGEADLDPAVRDSLEGSHAFLQTGTSPDHVGHQVLDAMARGQLHIFTDDIIRDMLVARHEQLMSSLDNVVVAHA